jgi:hypothetical protein
MDSLTSAQASFIAGAAVFAGIVRKRRNRDGIRSLTAVEVQLVISWAADEGWNPGLRDCMSFRSVDPQGFLGLFLGGELVACISIVHYSDAFAFLGFYICAKVHRGNGFGMVLWEAAIARAAGRVIGLDGVLEQQDNYARSGFVRSHNNIRFGGTPNAHWPESQNESVATSCQVTPIGTGAWQQYDRLWQQYELLTAVQQYDCKFFHADRSVFIRAWLMEDGHFTRVATTAEKIVGYGVLRPCKQGFKIAPLFADNELIARKLLADLIATAIRSATRDRPITIFIDAPEPNEAVRRICLELGLKKMFETVRMYTVSPAPPVDLAKVFGVTSFELG